MKKYWFINPFMTRGETRGKKRAKIAEGSPITKLTREIEEIRWWRTIMNESPKSTNPKKIKGDCGHQQGYWGSIQGEEDENGCNPTEGVNLQGFGCD